MNADVFAAEGEARWEPRGNWRLMTPADIEKERGCGVAGAPAMRERVLELIPDAVPKLIKPLLEAGMISGWRDVSYARTVMGRLPTRKKG